MDPSLRHLRAFLVVARTRSFTRAAEVLHLSQPALTVQIRTLEDLLGIRLLDRSTRTVDLTRVGRDLVPALERALRELDGVLADLREVSTGGRGVVRVAVLPSFAASLMPDAIKAFRERHPGASFMLRDLIASRIVALVQTEEIDIGLIGGRVLHPDFEVLFRASDDLGVVFPLGHAIARHPSITAAALAEHPLVLMDPETSVRAVTDAAFAAAGLAPAPIAEATYMMTAVGMVRAGLGLAILPISAREAQSNADLGLRRIDDPNFTRPVALVKKAGRTLPPLSAAFADWLIEILTERPALDRVGLKP